LPAVPFILWSLEKIIQKETLKKYLALILFSLLVGFSTYFAHSTPYLFIFVLVWFLMLRKITNRHLIFSLAIFFACVLIVQAESILATFMNSSFSQRSSWDLSSESFYPQGPLLSVLKNLKDTNFDDFMGTVSKLKSYSFSGIASASFTFFVLFLKPYFTRTSG